MSYDIHITVAHPDGYSSNFEVGNMTYNVARMTHVACGVAFSWFDGMPTAIALPILAHCWRVMKRNPATFRVIGVSEWGSYDQFMPYLTRFYAMARLHPTGVIRVQ
jgi:hypothetical protein